MLTNGERSGSWHDINRRYGTADTVTQTVFTLGIDHGAKPDHARYAWIVAPGAGPDAAVPDTRLLSNTASVQAVQRNGRIAAAFYGADLLMLDAGIIGVDRGCILLWKPAADRASLHVALPDYDPRRDSAVTIMLPGNWTAATDNATATAIGNDQTAVAVTCHGGQTASVELRRK